MFRDFIQALCRRSKYTHVAQLFEGKPRMDGRMHDETIRVSDVNYGSLNRGHSL